MQISNLPASNSFSSTDVLPIEINGVTYKVTGATLAAALQTLGNYLTTDNVANNLTTTAAGSVLDARQGKVLADDVGELSSAMTYVVSGNKSIESVTIPVGAYVRLVGSTIAGRSDGIYTVATAIPVNTVIDGTYFNESAPIAGGIANALNASIVKVATVTGTTSTGGNINANGDITDFIVISAFSNGYSILPWCSSQGVWYLRAINESGGTMKVVPNTQMTITYLYIDV